MFIDFEKLKIQGATNETIIHILEQLYNEVNNVINTNIILNEKVIGLELNSNNPFEFNFYLTKKPTATNDIFIVDESGEIIITPNSILSIAETTNKITIKNSKINKDTVLFVTYKF